MTTTSPSWAANPTVEVRAVSKWFGQKVAVSDLTCAFGPGVTGLLGPNGAGKTTLLRMLVGLLSPSDGEISVLGKDPRHNPEVYRSLAMVPEEDAVYGFQTARQFAGYAAVLSGAGPEAAERAIATVELGDAADRPISGFSKGMRQRAKVAAALVLDAPILVLDEPLNGTDPVQRAHLIATFRRLAAEGRTVIVSSHVLAEVERMADRVLAIVDGKLAAAGDVAAIRQAMTDIPYRVRLEADDARRLAAALIGSAAVQAVTVQGRVLTVETGDLAGLGPHRGPAGPLAGAAPLPVRARGPLAGERLPLPGEGPMRAFLALVGNTVRQQLGGRRIIVLLLLGLLPAGVLGILLADESTANGARQAFHEAPLAILFFIVLPVASLVFGAGALGDERRDGTLSFILLRPLPRSLLVTAKLLGGWLAAFAVVGTGALAMSVLLGIRFATWEHPGPPPAGGGPLLAGLRLGVPHPGLPDRPRRAARPGLRVRVGERHDLRHPVAGLRLADAHRAQRLHRPGAAGADLHRGRARRGASRGGRGPGQGGGRGPRRR